MQISHCHNYERLLIQHLREHETISTARHRASSAIKHKSSTTDRYSARLILCVIYKLAIHLSLFLSLFLSPSLSPYLVPSFPPSYNSENMNNVLDPSF